MVIFDLICDSQHEFEGWFKNSQDLADQQKNGSLTCPVCNSGQVNKVVSAPKVGRKTNSISSLTLNNKQSSNKEHSASVSSSSTSAAEIQQFEQFKGMLKKVHDYVERNYEDVGNKFSEEAISMHKGEKERANIRGIASKEQVQELAKEGVTAIPLPAKPIDKDKLN